MKTSQNSGARRIVAAILSVLAAGATLPSRAIDLVSSKADGSHANSDSTHSALSRTGRYVAFTSAADNLVPGDTAGAWDIFVKDRVTGAIERVNVDAAGNQTSGLHSGTKPSISDDGRYVVFSSTATNLVANDTNGREDVFLKDRATGAVTLVSVNGSGAQGDRDSYAPMISGDGRCVAFSSQSTNMGGAPPNGNHNLFLKDLVTGAVDHISVDSDENAIAGSAYDPVVSRDGTKVLFLLERFSPSYRFMVMLRDRVAGTTVDVGLNSQGEEANDMVTSAQMTSDARWIVFTSTASNLVANDTNFIPDVFVRDLENGVTSRVSVHSSGGQAVTGSFYDVGIAGTGPWVSYRSDSPDLVDNDNNAEYDVFLHHVGSGETVRLSKANDGGNADGASNRPAISASGAVIAFSSGATNLLPADGNGGTSDIFAIENPFYVPLRQPDNRIGASPASAIGDGIYNTTGALQTLIASSRRARVVRTHLYVENDGDDADTFRMRGSGGDRYFKVLYTAGTNRTAQVLAGTHAAGPLDPGARASLAITVTPNRKTLLKTTRKGAKTVKKWKRAERAFLLKSTSQGDTMKTDTAVHRVRHR